MTHRSKFKLQQSRSSPPGSLGRWRVTLLCRAPCSGVNISRNFFEDKFHIAGGGMIFKRYAD
jgi:hypothetical protein